MGKLEQKLKIPINCWNQAGDYKQSESRELSSLFAALKVEHRQIFFHGKSLAETCYLNWESFQLKIDLDCQVIPVFILNTWTAMG